MAAIVTREYKNFSLDPNSKAQYHASIGTSISIIVNSVLGNPGKMVPGKNGPWKIDPRKIGPRETQKRKIVGWASFSKKYVFQNGVHDISRSNQRIDLKFDTLILRTSVFRLTDDFVNIMFCSIIINNNNP